jgi:replicative DNA helicase
VNDIYYPNDDELGMIGACLTGNIDTCSDALAEIRSEWINQDNIRQTFDVIRTMVQANQQPSLSELGKEWKKAYGQLPLPYDAWNQAMEACPSPANLPYYTKGIIEAAHRRQLRSTGDRLIRESAVTTLQPDQIVANAEAGLTIEVSQEMLATSKKVAGNFIDQMQDRFNRKGSLSGIATGFHWLDNKTDGLQLREMAIIAARPSIGKTAIAIAIAYQAAIQDKVPTLFVSLEMSQEAIFRRMVSTIGSIPMQNLKSGDLTDGDMKSMMAASAKISSSPLWFLDGPSSHSIASITAHVRRAVRKHNVRLVIVDYIQKVKAADRSEKRTYEVAEVSGKLKAIAVQTGVAMLALAQLNRESEKEKGRQPKLSDLADSGSLERDADVVMLLNRDRTEPSGEAAIIIAKQRDGECGQVKLHYEGQFCRFTDPSPSLNQ